MNSDLLKYLQQDGIGKVIAKGLADVYTNKPQAPVKYLAAWLRAYSSNQKEIAKLSQEQTTKMRKLKQHNLKIQESDTKVAAKREEENKVVKELENFKEKIRKDEYQKQLLFHQLPEFIEKRLNLTGVYIGYVKHPPRQITDEDEDDDAHLNTTEPKMINYIGSSTSHAELMLGKTLPLDKGVTGGALSLSLDDPQPNEEGIVEAKQKYVYIPNVEKNQSMTYFRLPKLGAFIAVPLVYQSYLTEHIFDVALQARQKYLTDLDEFEKAKVETLKEIEAEVQAGQQKLADARQKADQANIQTAQSELAEINRRKQEKEEQKFSEQSTELPTQKKEFLICGDTTGKDIEITPEKRELLIELAKHFRDSWQKKEKELLYKDVNYQVNIEKDNEVPAEIVIENIEKCMEIPAEVKATFDQIEDEQLREYKKSTWQLEALKKQLQSDQQYLAAFFKLKNFRVVKFRSLIQTLLYFLRYEKSKINQPNKTRLDWKKVRANYLYAETFSAVLNYNSEGPKTEEYPFYCRINHINEKLSKYSELEVYKYNVGLGGLLTLIKKEITHRIANIELRRGEKEKERQQRDQVLQENQKIAEEKRQALEKHKQSLVGEDLQAFEEQGWSEKYDEQNPLKEIPPEVVDDIDNDF